MISTAILTVALCGVYSSAQTTNFTIPDDQVNWKAIWKTLKVSKSSDSRSAVADSTRPDLFDIILRANAQARRVDKAKARSGETEFLFQGDIAMNKREIVSLLRSRGRGKRAVMRKLPYRLWQPNNIAYVISNDLGKFAKQGILAAIKQWEKALPCMGKWKDISKAQSSKRPRDYILFFKGEGCYSRVGRQGGRQVVSIGTGCEQVGVVVHEIGHAMGFWHEQSRTDRDNHVIIHWNNILPAMRFNFEKYASSKINDLGVGYDYQSVMHYGSRAFSKDGRSVTISVKSGKNIRLGQRYKLSDKDKEQAQLLYNCKSKPSPCSSSPCLNGGKCRNNGDKYSCKCTSGYAGVRCDRKVVLKPSPCSSYPCLNSGVCRNNGDKYSCSCTYGHTGVRCENKIVCDDKDARCNQWAKNGFCGPDKGYEAYMKEKCCAACHLQTTAKSLPCSSSPCLNSGVCSNNGDKYSCKCSSKYTGTRCQTKVQPCSSSPCFNGGTCRDKGDRYSCSCTSRYTGTRCQMKVLPCNSSPCLNGGTCSNNGDKYSCRCTTGYTGVKCETRTSTVCIGNKQSGDNCGKWKDYCVSGSEHYAYMKRNCCRTCEQNCRDKNKYCKRWTSNGFCRFKTFTTFMKKNCVRSCGLC